MNTIEEIAAQNQKRAFEIIEAAHIIPLWESIHAKINLVGSLKTGLLMSHRDIDFHIYTPTLNVSKSFSVMAQLANNPAIKRIEFINSANTDEKCLEWHAWYQDTDEQLWQIDLIQILKGSFYDGYFERVAKRILAILTPETRLTILTLKHDTPETEKIMGIEYYQAVLQDGICNYADISEWRKKHPVTGIVNWMP